jgi:hypothetical protein
MDDRGAAVFSHIGGTYAEGKRFKARAEEVAAALRQAASLIRELEAELTRLRNDRRPRPSDREWEERWEGENKRAEAAEAKLTRYAAVVTAAMWVRRFLSVWDDRSGVWVRGADTETTVVAVEKFLAALDQQEGK